MRQCVRHSSKLQQLCCVRRLANEALEMQGPQGRSQKEQLAHWQQNRRTLVRPCCSLHWHCTAALFRRKVQQFVQTPASVLLVHDCKSDLVEPGRHTLWTAVTRA